MICPKCRIKMDYFDDSNYEWSQWICPKCNLTVDENDERFKWPSLIEKMEAKSLVSFTKDDDDGMV